MSEEMRVMTYDNGVLVETIDTRTLAGEKSRRIVAIKEQAGEAILSAYPIYKQQNAALGIYSEEQTQAIKDGIQALRNECDAQEAAINACETLSELDKVYLYY